MNRAAEVVNNEYGTYKTRRRRETYNGNGKNQSGAAARYALRGKQCGVVHRLFYSFYRCRRIHDGYKPVKRLGVGAVRSYVFHSAVLHIFNVCELLLVGRACREKYRRIQRGA